MTAFTNIVNHSCSAGELRYSIAADNFQDRKKTSGFALKYVMSGREDYRINGNIVRVNQGQFLLVRDEQDIEVSLTPKSKSIEGICLDLNPDLFLDDLSSIESNDLIFDTAFLGTYSTGLGKAFNSLEKTEKSEFDSIAISGFQQGLRQFSQDITDLRPQLDELASKRDSQKALLSRLLWARDFIHRSFRRKITLDMLGKQVGISKYHLQRSFKTCFGVSPLELTHELRMKEAEKLLLDGGRTLSEIAFFLGYSNLPAFSLHFKQRSGYPPSHFVRPS